MKQGPARKPTVKRVVKLEPGCDVQIKTEPGCDVQIKTEPGLQPVKPEPFVKLEEEEDGLGRFRAF